MSDLQPQTETKSTSREGSWAKPVSRLDASKVQADIHLNVTGRAISSPVQGFGQMWQKTYRISLAGASATPQQVIQAWKENFGSFWPKENHFYGTKVAVNEVAVLNLAGPMGLQAPGGRGLVSTGVLVMYEDEESFSFITPDGHIFAAFITFSAAQTDDGLEAKIVALIRASDPIFELGARMGVVHKMEDSHWHRVLGNLANHFGVQGMAVKQENILVDPRVQWSQAKNVWHNSAIHTGLYLAASPFRWVAKALKLRS